MGSAVNVIDAISADGSFLAGSARVGADNHAVRWRTEVGTPTLVSELLANEGLDMSGWTLSAATLASHDGAVLVVAAGFDSVTHYVRVRLD